MLGFTTARSPLPHATGGGYNELVFELKCINKDYCVMSCRILIVEDEIFVAAEIEQIVSEMGHEPIGIAADKKGALRHAAAAEVALVDLNLRDGATGIEIGKILAQTHGVSVVFLTANPSQLGTGVPGTIGVMSKPVAERDLRAIVEYASSLRAANDAQPPRRLRLFDGWGGGEAVST